MSHDTTTSAEQKERAREIIKQLDALYNAKRPGGGVHGQVIGMELWTIRTTGDGLQCVFDAQSLLDELLDPFDHRAAMQAAEPVRVDPMVEANRALLHERSQVGIRKYGVTLGDANLSERALVQHALEEALDLSNYLQANLQRLDAAPDRAPSIDSAAISRAGRVLADRSADACGIDREDNWKVYGQDFIEDAKAAIAALQPEGCKP